MSPNGVSPISALNDAILTPKFRVASLESVLRIKLEIYRNKDGMHIVDLMNVGLIDHSWLPRFSSPLKERLEKILNDENERLWH